MKASHLTATEASSGAGNRIADGSLKGRVALVSGASSGFGAAFATWLAAEGATVVALARRLDRLRELSAVDERIVAMRCDVTDETACRAVVEECLRAYGRIDVLVNNAGTSNVAPAERETPAQFRSVVETNLVAAFTLTHLVAPAMLRHGGCVVNIASIVGLVGLGRMPQAAYAASKAGLIGLTRELALQWARKGIRVNAIAPAFFPTELTEELFAVDSGRDWVSRLTPMGRGGEIAELRGALLYLASDASSYTTGAVIPVDGGWTAA